MVICGPRCAEVLLLFSFHDAHEVARPPLKGLTSTQCYSYIGPPSRFYVAYFVRTAGLRRLWGSARSTRRLRGEGHKHGKASLSSMYMTSYFPDAPSNRFRPPAPTSPAIQRRYNGNRFSAPARLCATLWPNCRRAGWAAGLRTIA